MQYFIECLTILCPFFSSLVLIVSYRLFRVLFLSFLSRSSYASAVLAVVILSVYLSVTRVLCDKTKQRTAAILIHTKGQSLRYSDTNSSWWMTPPSFWNLRSKWPTPFETRWLRQIFAHNVSTARDSEKTSIMTNRKSTTRAFQRATDRVRTLPLTPRRVAQ